MDSLPQGNPPASPKMSWRLVVAALLVILIGFLVYRYIYPGSRLALIGGTAVVGEVSMSLQASPSSVLVGQQFTVDVILDAGVNRVSATEIHLTFPSQLRANSLMPGSFLPVNLLPGVVGVGRADIAVGSQLQASPSPQGIDGSGVVATVTFTASQSGTFQIQIDPTTEVAAIGELTNVLTTRNAVTVTVTSPTSSLPPTPTPTPTSTSVPTPTPTPSLTIIPFNSSWKYLDNGSNQGTAWRASAFNDATWVTGQAQLGYGEGDERTVVSYGPSASKKYVTTYFRKTFTVDSPGLFKSLVMKVLKDDGAVVYVNGNQVARTDIPATFTYTTLANATRENTTTSYTLNSSVLVAGTNVIAVEVHQAARNSSDISFDLSLVGK